MHIVLSRGSEPFKVHLQRQTKGQIFEALGWIAGRPRFHERGVSMWSDMATRRWKVIHMHARVLNRIDVWEQYG